MAKATEGNWFSRNWGWLALGGIGILTAIFGYRAYCRRDRMYDDISMARFYKPGTSDVPGNKWFDAMGIRGTSASFIKGLKAGDTISILPQGGTRRHEVKVIDTWEDTRPGREAMKWQIIAEPYPGWVDDVHTGTLKLV